MTQTAAPTAEQQARWTRLGQTLIEFGRARDAARAAGDNANVQAIDAMIDAMIDDLLDADHAARA